MRPAAFGIAAFVALVVQLSLANALTLASLGYVQPNIVASVAVFIALFANRMSVLWACWGLGLLVDLVTIPADCTAPVVGPNAFGYVAGGLLVLQLRTMVFRRRAITMSVLTLAFLLAAGVAAVLVLVARSWFLAQSGMDQGPLHELWTRIVIALYTAVIMFPLSFLLNATMPLWGFQSAIPRRTAAVRAI